jgi:polar amino acid transport system substrate-binding protein
MLMDENPPQTYRDASGNLEGSSLEMVEAMMETTGYSGPVEYSLWSNAYELIKFVPNSMAFSTLRSPDREDLFHWVGPLCRKRYCFYVNASTDYDISTIDAARRMRSVGTVSNWASEEELISLGFNNIVTWPTPQEVFQKLMDGEIPCAVLNDISMRFLGTQAGHPPKDYRQGAVLSEGMTYVAFSKDTDDDYLSAWQAAYDQLVSSGKFAGIWTKWYPDIEW